MIITKTKRNQYNGNKKILGLNFNYLANFKMEQSTVEILSLYYYFIFVSQKIIIVYLMQFFYII